MKKLTLSAVAVLAMSTFVSAGGDIEPIVEPVAEVVTPVVDNSGFYVGGGISALSWSEKGMYSGFQEWMPMEEGDYEATWTGGTLLAGYQFNQYLAIEGRYTKNMTDASWEDHGEDDGDADDDISNIALYVKPMYPIGDLSLYGLLGYGKTTLNYEDDPEDHSESGFQWGLGAAYGFTEQFSAFVDYVVFYDDTGFDTFIPDWDYKVDSITLGVMYKF